MGCHFLLQCAKVKSESEVAQSCPTLSDPMDCSPSGPSIHGIFQARVLEWGTIAFSRHIYPRGQETLRYLGLVHPTTHPPYTRVSGGWQMRVSITTNNQRPEWLILSKEGGLASLHPTSLIYSPPMNLHNAVQSGCMR